MSQWTKVASADEIAPGQKKIVEADGLLLVIVNLGGQYYALEDVCTHDGGPLGEGEFDVARGQLVCPRHGARFDVQTGAARALPAVEPVPIYEVRVENGDVLVSTY